MRCGASRSGPACPSSTSRRARTSASCPAEGHGAFLRSRGAGIEPGDIVDREGRILGRHRGIACYTIGQRGGLGVSSPAPLYVLAIDAPHNRLVVGGKTDLRAEGLIADQVNRLVDSFPEEARAKIRYAHRAARCRISEEDGRLTVRFAEPQEAVCTGTIGRALRRGNRSRRRDHPGGVPWRWLKR